MIDWPKVTDWLSTHGVNILVIIVLSIVTFIIIRKLVPGSIRRSLSGTMKGYPEVEIEKRRVTLTHLSITTGSLLIIVIAIFLVLSELGINIAALIAGFGVVGIAIGFGAQNLVKDIIAGFIIMLENQYNIDDVVSIAGTTGIVEAVNMRRTILRDLDGILHIVPNGEIKTTGNYTRTWSRAHLNISVAYKEDVDQVMSIIRNTWEEVAEDPNWKPFIISSTPRILRLNEFGDSGFVIKVVGETQPIKQWDVMGELRRRIKKAFDQQGIEIAWPRRKVYFGGDSGLPGIEQPIEKPIEKPPDRTSGSQPGSIIQDTKNTMLHDKTEWVVCNQCENENPPGHKFCHACGAKLTA